jgi:hypothetical protein
MVFLNEFSSSSFKTNPWLLLVLALTDPSPIIVLTSIKVGLLLFFAFFIALLIFCGSLQVKR